MAPCEPTATIDVIELAAAKNSEDVTGARTVKNGGADPPAVLVKVVVALTPLYEAVMVVLPAVQGMTSPVAETVAMARLDELQARILLRFCTCPSEKVPVAVSWVA